MSGFIIGAVLLCVLAALILLRRGEAPLREADRDDPNLQWYRLRRDELGDEDRDALLEEAQLRLLEEGVGDAPPAPAEGGSGRFPGWLLVPSVLLLAGLIYSQLGAVEDVLIYRDIEAFDGEREGALEDLAARIERRSAQRPENLQYLGLLAQLQLGQEDYLAAAQTHTRMAILAPQDPSLQAQAAQTRFMAAGRVLDEQSQLFAERALALDPQQSMALGLLGMASFERGQFGAAVTYWERLQALEAPGSQQYQLLDDVIAAARTRMGDDTAVAGTAQATDVDSAPGVTVSLALAETARAAPDAVVFVFARRAAATSRMPIAARRLSAADLPLTLRLSDADSMAGQQLSGAGEIVVSAQLSRNGQPGEANALYLGSSVPVVAGDGEVAVSIELSPPRGDS